MKLTQTQALDLLKQAGLADVEVVEDEKDSDYSFDEAIKAIDASREPILSANNKGAYEKAAMGRLNGTLRSALARATNIPKSEFTEEMTFDETIKKALDFVHSKYDGDKQNTQAEIDKILSKHNEEKEKLVSEWEGKYNGLNSKYTERDIVDYFMNELNNAPLPKDLPKNIAAQDLYGYMKSRFKVEWDETTKKARYIDPNTGIEALNENKNMPLALLDEAKNYFAPRRLWETDMRHRNPADELGKVGQPLPNDMRNDAPPIGSPEELTAKRQAAYQQVPQ